jgi:hypothetical protein
MKRTRRFVVREKTFGLTAEFYCGTPQATALRRCIAILQCDPNDPDNQPDDSDAAWAMCYGSQAVVWIEHIADTGSLVHELYHIVQDFLKHITSSDEETGAYLIQYLYREARRRLDKK